MSPAVAERRDGGRAIRVLVVDDSRTICSALKRGLSQDPAIEVVATANNAHEAREQLMRHAPDVMTLDLTMPGMGGLDFLRWLMPQHPMPVVVVSHLTRPGSREMIDALALGAVDAVCKSTEGGAPALMRILRDRIRAAGHARRDLLRPTQMAAPEAATYSAAGSGVQLIAVGASTGGLDAIYRICRELPADGPPVVITQHMPPVFTKHFAERLDTSTAMSVKEGATGAVLERGSLFVAPGGRQMRVVRRGTRLVLDCEGTEQVTGHCPSVNVLFDSVATAVGGDAVGVILTGMGRDGATGLLAMRESGAPTIAQDEATSVVYGMPKAAAENGAAEQILAIDRIPAALARLLAAPASARGA